MKTGENYPNMTKLVEHIRSKNEKDGIKVYPPASTKQIYKLEKAFKCKLPKDFIAFYSACDGFECIKEGFRFLSIDEILQKKTALGRGWFYFSEYDAAPNLWGMRMHYNVSFEIFCRSHIHHGLTTSLESFLEVFLAGNVLGDEGLNQWQEKIVKVVN